MEIKIERVMKLGKLMRESHSTSDNSSHPLSGFLRQNDIFSFKIFFSKLDKIAVKNPKQRVSAKRYQSCCPSHSVVAKVFIKSRNY
jgi:hypothetical protein